MFACSLRYTVQILSLCKFYIHFFLCCLCRYEYHWADGTNIKKPIKCSAPKYIDYLMTWVQDQLDDETLFPSKIGEFHSCSQSFCDLKYLK